MLWKYIFIVVILKTTAARCEHNYNGFELLRSLNTIVTELRQEQKLMLQQTKEDREYIYEPLKQLKDDQNKIIQDVIRIKETQVTQQQYLAVKEDLKHINDTVQQLSKNHLKFIEEAMNKTRHEDKQSKVTYDRNCDKVNSMERSGVHQILIPSYSPFPFKVFCEGESLGGGWIVILRRVDGSVNFDRNWDSYKIGFGHLNGEFFLGLQLINALTSSQRMELLIILEDQEGNVRHAAYDEFAIGNEKELYKLHTLGKYNGTAGDSLGSHRDMKFTTNDKDNDRRDGANCADQWSGGWWYDDCFQSKLTGKHADNTNGKGINWKLFRGVNHSLKRAEVMIRRTKEDAN